MLKKAIFLTIGFSICSLFANSKLDLATDSLRVHSLQVCNKTNSMLNPGWAALGASSALITSGIIAKRKDQYLRNFRNTYAPNVRMHYDDYLQYLPAGVLVGMKLGGIKGRSSWKNMLVADAISTVLMASCVNAVKSISKISRPDGSNTRSFPSGHTATGFMTATMMSKEYGPRSIWYSVGAYSIAGATGVSRILNNKHWLSDVIVGAGIGIFSTELGYLIADLTFKKQSFRASSITWELSEKPSFLGCYWGAVRLRCLQPSIETSPFSFSAGTTAGFEGAYFFTPYIGLGGNLGFANFPALSNSTLETELLSIDSGALGVYLSYPICHRWQVGSKFLLGHSRFKYSGSTSYIQSAFSNGFTLLGGYSISFRVDKRIGMKLFFDYALPKWSIHLSGPSIRMLTVGTATYIAF